MGENAPDGHQLPHTEASGRKTWDLLTTEGEQTLDALTELVRTLIKSDEELEPDHPELQAITAGLDYERIGKLFRAALPDGRLLHIDAVSRLKDETDIVRGARHALLDRSFATYPKPPPGAFYI